MTEYDIQAQSGVLQSLENLPDSESYVDLDLRKSKVLDFWNSEKKLHIWNRFNDE